MDFDIRVDKLRKLLQEKNIDYYIINTNDDHLMETPNPYWSSINWLCGFSGSFAMAVVDLFHFVLWTDGRYVLQARKQILLKQAEIYNVIDSEQPNLYEWLRRQMAAQGKERYRIAFDGRTFSETNVQEMMSEWEQSGSYQVEFLSREDLLSEIWTERPPQRHSEIFEHPLAYCGRSRTDKLAQVRQRMAEHGAGYYLLSSLDDIAWLTNLRGHDYPVHPLFPAYMLISMEEAVLFLEAELGAEPTQALAEDNIQLVASSRLTEYLCCLGQGSCIYYDAGQLTHFVVNALPQGLCRMEGFNLISLLKAEKNTVEINNLYHCNIEEGVALCRVIKKLKEELYILDPDEVDVGRMLEVERRRSGDYVMAGNVPIVGYMENAALPHYRPCKESAVKLRPEGIVLFDVVGHYLSGTTDISRTIAIGSVTKQLKRDYTVVLKALIALSRQLFLPCATGAALDMVARSVLWNHGLDCPHGIGHGVGYCLTVHESPPSLTSTWYKKDNQLCNISLRPGMVMTNEPGVYRVHEYGIRLENNMVVLENEEGGSYLRLDTLTVCPFDRELIISELLDPAELQWLNDYHQTVYRKLLPYLTEEEQTWLAGQTALVC